MKAERKKVWLEQQASKAQGPGASEANEVAPAETSRAARRRLREERHAAIAAESSSSSSSSSDEEADNMDTDDACMFAATNDDADQNIPTSMTDGAGSSAESEPNPGPYMCLFCGEEFPSEAAEDYHVMNECSNKD